MWKLLLITNEDLKLKVKGLALVLSKRPIMGPRGCLIRPGSQTQLPGGGEI